MDGQSFGQIICPPGVMSKEKKNISLNGRREEHVWDLFAAQLGKRGVDEPPLLRFSAYRLQV